MTRFSTWRAELALADSGSTPSGLVTITIGGSEFVGTVDAARIGQDKGGRTSLTVIGGAGGLETVVERLAYTSTTVGVVLNDILKFAGETLSSTVDASVVDQSLLRWSRSKATAGSAIQQLAEHLGYFWRILDDGTVWFGTDTFPESLLTEFTVDEEDPKSARDSVATEFATLRPAETFRSRRVDKVVYDLDDTLRAHVEYESSGRFGSAFDAAISKRTAKLEYAKSYEGKVLKQNSDGTLELRVFDERIPHLSKVPYLTGAPGLTIEVENGTLVKLEFLNGDRTRPAVTSFGKDGLTCISVDGGDKNVARVDDTVDIGVLTLGAPLPPNPLPSLVYKPPLAPLPLPPADAIQLIGLITSGMDGLKG